MSDDKKRDRALQRRVRERQAKTGESYQAAWRQLTGSDAPQAEPAKAGDAESLQEAWSQLIGSPAPKATAGSTVDPGSALSGSPREVIPLHLPRVPQNQRTRVAARAANGAIDVERLFLSGAATPGGAADWIVHDLEIDGRSQLTSKDLPGSLFSGGGVTALFSGFDPVERDHELAVVVTYVGPNPEGVPFYASVVGKKPVQRPTVIPIASKTPVPLLTKTTILVRVQDVPFQIERIEIQDSDTSGGAADWIVNDLRVNGRSQFFQSGDIPGDMFATTAIDTFVKIEPCDPGLAFEVDVTYIGSSERGAIFAARLEGTVLRDDYSAAPPDLHALVETIGQGPGELVVATCNWRAPASDNRTR